MLLQMLANGLVSGCVYALLGLSFALIYNTTRTLHIAHGAMYSAGAYACYLFLAVVGWPLWISVGLALLISAVLGSAIEVLVYAPLVRRGGSLLVALLSSLGLYVAMVNTIALFFGNEIQVLRPGVETTYALGAVILTRTQLAQVVAAALLLPSFVLFLRFSVWGKVIRAVRDNAVLASVLGINVAGVRVAVFALGSALVALAAVLTALDLGIEPHSGMPALLTAAVVLIVGGVGTFEGPVLGGFVLGLLQSLVVWKFSTRWLDAVTFAVLILFLLLRPSGLLGRRFRLEEAAKA